MMLCVVAVTGRAQWPTQTVGTTPMFVDELFGIFSADANESEYLSAIQSIVTNGLAAYGPWCIQLDDGWSTNAYANGVIQVRTDRFPGYITNIYNLAHSNGMYAGIYTEFSPFTLASAMGLEDTNCFQTNVNLWARWGVDYVKFQSDHFGDWDTDHTNIICFAQCWQATGRPVYLYWVGNVGGAGPDGSEYWPGLTNFVSGWYPWCHEADSIGLFGVMVTKLRLWARYPNTCGPRHHVNIDQSFFGYTNNDKTAYNVCVMLNSDIVCPLTGDGAANPYYQYWFTNSDFNAVWRDPLGVMGQPVPSLCYVTNGVTNEVWLKPLADASQCALMLLNTDTQADYLSFSLTNLNIGPGPARVYDLWSHTNYTILSNQTACVSVPAVSSTLFKITSEPPPVLANPMVLGDGSVRFDLAVTTGTTCTVQFNPELGNPDGWQTILATNAGTNWLSFTNMPPNGVGSGYYRAFHSWP
jgi:hypothetical protein